MQKKLDTTETGERTKRTLLFNSASAAAGAAPWPINIDGLLDARHVGIGHLDGDPIIEACSPVPFIELFARGSRAGWVSWGHEAKGYEMAVAAE